MYAEQEEMKMGWVNYIYSEKLKLAIEVGKFTYNDEYKKWDRVEEFIEYMGEEEPKIDIIKYLYNNCYFNTAFGTMVNLMLEIYKDADWEIIAEDDERLKKCKVRLTR